MNRSTRRITATLAAIASALSLTAIGSTAQAATPTAPAFVPFVVADPPAPTPHGVAMGDYPVSTFALPASRLPAALNVFAPLAQPLRYGENPHQAAALYGGFNEFFQQLHGKELSYNNILDLTAAAGLIAEFTNDPPTLESEMRDAVTGALLDLIRGRTERRSS